MKPIRIDVMDLVGIAGFGVMAWHLWLLSPTILWAALGFIMLAAGVLAGGFKQR